MEGAADATGFDWRAAPLAPKYREFFSRRPG